MKNLRKTIALFVGVDFLSVAVHELGHSLGLAHSPDYSSIMFPYYKGPAEATTLKYDDIMGMYELYSELNECLICSEMIVF